MQFGFFFIAPFFVIINCKLLKQKSKLFYCTAPVNVIMDNVICGIILLVLTVLPSPKDPYSWLFSMKKGALTILSFSYSYGPKKTQ